MVSEQVGEHHGDVDGHLPSPRGLSIPPPGTRTPGAALAFLITGAGTSVGAVAGALAIARWRVIGLVVASLLVGAVLAGIVYNAWVPLGRI